jgi:peroxiredoxin
MLKRIAAAVGALAALSAGCASRQPAPPDPLLEQRAQQLEKEATQKQPPPLDQLQAERLRAQLAELAAKLQKLAESNRPAPVASTAPEPPEPAPPANSAQPEGEVLLVKFSEAFPEETWDGWFMRGMGEDLYQRYLEGGVALEKSTVGDGLIGKPPPQLKFLGPDGSIFNLGEFRGRERLVLVFLRGFPGYVCVACTAQTAAFAAKQKEFEARDAQIIFIYPGHPDTVPTFLEATRNFSSEFELPFPVLLDVNFAASERFGVKGDLAKPSAIIIDKGGIVRYAYVGESYDDRPAAPDLLAQLDKIRD